MKLLIGVLLLILLVLTITILLSACVAAGRYDEQLEKYLENESRKSDSEIENEYDD